MKTYVRFTVEIDVEVELQDGETVEEVAKEMNDHVNDECPSCDSLAPSMIFEDLPNNLIHNKTIKVEPTPAGTYDD